MCESKESSSKIRTLGNGDYIIEKVCQQRKCPHPHIVATGRTKHDTTMRYGQLFKAHNKEYH